MTCRLYRPSKNSCRDSFLLRHCSLGYGVDIAPVASRENTGQPGLVKQTTSDA